MNKKQIRILWIVAILLSILSVIIGLPTLNWFFLLVMPLLLIGGAAFITKTKRDERPGERV
jgi:flagellar biosynthesis component FlhA